MCPLSDCKAFVSEKCLSHAAVSVFGNYLKSHVHLERALSKRGLSPSGSLMSQIRVVLQPRSEA